MKVLLISNYGADYGSYMMAHGLVNYLGRENVVMYPHKNTFHGGVDEYPERTVGNRHYLGPGGPGISWSELWLDQKWWRAWEKDRWPDVPVAKDGAPGFYVPLEEPEEIATFDTVMRDYLRGEFSCIILNDVRWFSSAALAELQSNGVNLPVVICDHEDYYQIRWDFVKAFGPKLYFKRSFMDGHTDWLGKGDCNVPVLPLPFGSIWDYEFIPWAEREHELFCVFGATQVLRERVANIAKEFANSHPEWRCIVEVGHPFKHPEYMHKLRHSKVVIDHQRLGVDTVRTWEVLSTGACMIGDICMKMPHPLKDKQHYIQYENDMSAEGDRQKLETFREALQWAYDHPLQVRKIAEDGYRHVRINHTTEAHAKYVLAEIENVLGVPA
jgi:hypothetical protein